MSYSVFYKRKVSLTFYKTLNNSSLFVMIVFLNVCLFEIKKENNHHILNVILGPKCGNVFKGFIE